MEEVALVDVVVQQVYLVTLGKYGGVSLRVVVLKGNQKTHHHFGGPNHKEKDRRK